MKRKRRVLKHGLSLTPEYRAWQLARLRCIDPGHAAYPGYGGRGIRMHAPWLEDPAAFVAHVGKRPSLKHELDREDNDGNYEPGNVRWVVRKVNDRNRRSNRVIRYRGETMTMVEWCERLNLPYVTIAKRFSNGWTPGRAFTTPVRTKRANGALALTQAQLLALGMLIGGPRWTYGWTFVASGVIGGPVAQSLVDRGLAEFPRHSTVSTKERRLVKITMAGRTALKEAT